MNRRDLVLRSLVVDGTPIPLEAAPTLEDLQARALVLLDEVLARPGYYVTAAEQDDDPWCRLCLRWTGLVCDDPFRGGPEAWTQIDRRVAVLARCDWRQATRNALSAYRQIERIRFRDRGGKRYVTVKWSRKRSGFLNRTRIEAVLGDLHGRARNTSGGYSIDGSGEGTWRIGG